jgi:hypothetical protein
VSALAVALRRVPPEARLDELSRRSKTGSFPRAVADCGRLGSEDGARVAALNLALAELDHEMQRGATWPKAAIRLALLAAALLALVSYLVTHLFDWPLAIALLGGIGAASCAQAERVARRHVDAQRAAADELVSVLFGRAPTPPEAAAGGRRLRRRGRAA